ncbi:hypothetical protein DICVIV_12102 [Dictyocaulus viviparus]|uniref:WD domain, G-beta repeat protein n=1 Tax=Dictyocaulus viviparus TaxID=29172 RepID=A0A0D8XE34_DICVI|nr:hypothetical protein DICVIV_12102 [Dictyocaulus viviparus]
MRSEIVRGYDVGGRRRQWSFHMRMLEFGREPLYTISFSYRLKSVQALVRPNLIHCSMFHCKNIKAVCVIKAANEMIFAVTTGYDRLVQVFSMNVTRGDWIILLALVVSSVPTTAQGVLMENRHIIVLIGAQDGVITIYILEPCDVCSGGTTTARSTEFRCRGQKSAVTCLYIIKQPSYRDEFNCLVSYGDGKMLMLTVKVDRVLPKCTVDKTKHFGTLMCQEGNKFSKVIGWCWEDVHIVCGGTSDGKLMVWRTKRTAAPKHVSTISIDNSPITSLTTSINEAMRFVAVGSSSGLISVFSFHGEIIVALSPFTVYQNPVAGIALDVLRSCLLIHSTSRNGQFSSYEITLSRKSVTRLAATYECVLKQIRDFADANESGFIAVGDGMEVIPPPTKMKNFVGKSIDQNNK